MLKSVAFKRDRDQSVSFCCFCRVSEWSPRRLAGPSWFLSCPAAPEGAVELAGSGSARDLPECLGSLEDLGSPPSRCQGLLPGWPVSGGPGRRRQAWPPRPVMLSCSEPARSRVLAMGQGRGASPLLCASLTLVVSNREGLLGMWWQPRPEPPHCRWLSIGVIGRQPGAPWTDLRVGTPLSGVPC